MSTNGRKESRGEELERQGRGRYPRVDAGLGSLLGARGTRGAPNVLVIAWDDVGYGAVDVFGGPIETPAMRKIADRGVRYANFHATALCSPTRASLLTGRNATSNGMATIAEFAAGYPGISTRIPFENGLISEVLAERGWNTYCVGKWHLTPGEECNVSAFKGRWPLGRGFERFYGYLNGESSSWYPSLYHDNHPAETPATPEEGYHLSEDLSDKAIAYISDGKVINPDKPFFMYLAPQAGHAPAEWVDRYKGRFDTGYEAIRPEILAREKELGLTPEDTGVSPINPHGEPTTTGAEGQPWSELDTVRPWESLRDEEKRLLSRMAEVFSGYIAYADDQLGRVLDYLEGSGQLDNTIVVVISDNGSSGEGGPDGSFNEWRFFNGLVVLRRDLPGAAAGRPVRAGAGALATPTGLPGPDALRAPPGLREGTGARRCSRQRALPSPSRPA